MMHYNASEYHFVLWGGRWGFVSPMGNLYLKYIGASLPKTTREMAEQWCTQQNIKEGRILIDNEVKNEY